MPRSWRITLDWLVTIVGAILIVLAIKQWVINPYRIPSSSMEPTLHCARPGNECEAGISDRVLACRFCYHLWDPKRGDIIVGVNGAATKTLGDFYRKLWATGAAGVTVPLDVQQSGAARRVDVPSANRLDHLKLKSTF